MLLRELIDDFSVNKDDIGFLTFQEFLDKTNPDGKQTPPTAYQASLDSLNSSYPNDSKRLLIRRGEYLSRIVYDKGDIIKYGDDIVGVVKGDTLYKILSFPNDVKPEVYFDYDELKVDKVRYLDDLISEITDVSDDNKSRYPSIWQNFKIQGEEFQIRSSVSKKDYEIGSQDTIVIMNGAGLIVSTVQDEYGATLIMSAKEYRGKGLGTKLFALWNELNPNFNSGGYSDAGIQTAKSTWVKRVRDLLNRGVYTKAINDGLITKSKVQEILKELPEKTPKPVEQPKKKGEILYYVSDNSAIIYDSLYLEDQDDVHIKGYGFISDNHDGYYIYDIGYVKEFEKEIHLLLASIAKSYDESIIVSSPPAEHNSYEKLGYKVEDGVMDVSSVKSILNDPRVSREKSMRKPLDKYGEILVSLITDAESKWN